MSKTVRPPLGLARSPLGTLAGRSARGKRSKHRGSSLFYRTALDGAGLNTDLGGELKQPTSRSPFDSSDQATLRAYGTANRFAVHPTE